MRLALIAILASCCAFAAAADQGITFSNKLAWEATKDAVLEFPHPEEFAITYGIAGFENALMFLGRGNASLAVSLLDERAAGKSLPKEVGHFEEDMKSHVSNCTKGQPGQGKLKNGWAASWTHFSCKNKDGTSSETSMVVFRAAGRLYLLSGLKVPPSWAIEMAGKGRLKK